MLCLFFTKDQDSFKDCLRENNIIPDKIERDRFKKHLQNKLYSKLILKMLSTHWLLFVVRYLLFVIICYAAG